ncbi:MAG TPA: helix-turn-helix domain-containing protein [Burkholderiaceae bacterium]|nr:helix-turn-helix domain-containing protein [Burkholderiaceae bacterium]
MARKRKRTRGGGSPESVKKQPISGAHSHSNAAAAQRARLLDALRCKPVSTIDARRELDILHPAGRVLELRRKGVPILTYWVTEPTDCGKSHRVARYTLQVRA